MPTINVTTESGMNAKKFALWLFIVSIVMIFASLTSAFLVRRAEGNWIIYETDIGETEMYAPDIDKTVITTAITLCKTDINTNKLISYTNCDHRNKMTL